MNFFYYLVNAGCELFTGQRIEKRVKAEGCLLPDCYLKGRPVYIENVSLDFVDSYVVGASYADTCEQLTDDELDELTELRAVKEYLVQQNIESYGYWQD